VVVHKDPRRCISPESPGRPDFPEFTFRNCLEERDGSRIGTPKADEEANEPRFGCLLPPSWHAREGSGYLRNRFFTHSGE
jgi:hypothetical protein